MRGQKTDNSTTEKTMRRGMNSLTFPTQVHIC